MNPHSILTLDLNNVTSEQRVTFYAKLAESGWAKLPGVTTIWFVAWATGSSEAGITQATKNHVEAAAKAANVTDYDATTAICATPVRWSKRP